MKLTTTPQVYLLPSGTQAFKDATATLALLGIKHEEPLFLNRGDSSVIQLVVMEPTIPVVHYYSLHEYRKELIQKRTDRVKRPSHTEAKERFYELPVEETAYEEEFFSLATQQVLAFSITEFIVREHVLNHFAVLGIKARKITFNKPANEALDGLRNRDANWFVLVEEARPVIADLASLLGAIQ